MREAMIRRFCEIVNEGLPGHDKSSEAVEQLHTEFAEDAESQSELITDLQESFRHAFEPALDSHFQRMLTGADSYFEQCYELMRRTFDPDELEPRERYMVTITLGQKAETDHPNIMVGRFWETLGLCRYTEDNQLSTFVYNPLHRGVYIAAMVNSNYMPIKGSTGLTGQCFGAIGHLSPYPPTMEHTAPLVLAYENTIRAMAAARGEQLRLFIIEGDDSTLNFLYEMGYRTPLGTTFYSAPMEFDPDDGTPTEPLISQVLMIKMENPPGATEIDTDLLRAVVHTMEDNWCIEDVDMSAFTDKAKARVRAAVNEAVKMFDDSLHGKTIALGDPRI